MAIRMSMEEGARAADFSRRERWLAGSLLLSLAVAGFLAFGPRPTGEPATADLGVLAPGAPDALPASRRRVPEEPLGECYLGVVLASEALDVVAQVEGRVVNIPVRPGDFVERGARLAILDTESLHFQVASERARLALAEAEVKSLTRQLEQAQLVLERRLALADLLSREEAESARVERDMARYQLEVAQARRAQAESGLKGLEARLRHGEIRAPFAGSVALRYLESGTLATPGMALVRLISTDASLVRFAVPPADAGMLAVGMEVRVEIEDLGWTVRGVLQHRSPEIDAVSHMVFVEARLVSAEMNILAVAPGAVARVSRVIPGGEPKSCLGPRGRVAGMPGTNGVLQAVGS